MVLVIRLHAIQEARVVSRVLRLHILSAIKKIGKEQCQSRELNQQHLLTSKHCGEKWGVSLHAQMHKHKVNKHTWCKHWLQNYNSVNDTQTHQNTLAHLQT